MTANGEDAVSLRDGLNRLRRQHRYVEDCWYSCPKAEEGCCDDAQGDECNCGADEHNALVDALLETLDDLAAYVLSLERRAADAEGSLDFLGRLADELERRR